MRGVNHIVPFILITATSCLTSNKNPSSFIQNAGLRQNATASLIQGDLTGALNKQVEAPKSNCHFLPVAATSNTSRSPLVKERPHKKNSDQENNAICEKRAKWARDNNVQTLTVSFEGLGSYNNSFNQKFYDYYDDLWLDKEPKKPKGSLSHVTKNLITPHLKDDYKKSDFLSLSEKGGAKTIEQCVAIYKRVIGDEFKLNIIGLSFGAGEALVLARKLSMKKEYGENGLPINNLMTMDLRGSERARGRGPRTRMNDNFQTPPNVKDHMNFGRFNASELLYVSPALGYPGYRSKSSGVRGTRTTNSLIPTSAGHAKQVKTKVIQSYFQEMI